MGGLKSDAGLWTPAAGGGGLPYVTDLAAHYAADQIAGLFDGDAVATWADLSGNGRTLTGFNSPTFQSDGSSLKNGLPVVRTVAASNQYFTAASFAHPVAFTLFVAWKSNASSQTGLGRIFEQGANNGVAVVCHSNNIKFEYSDSTPHDYDTPEAHGTGWHLIEYWGDGESPTRTMEAMHNGSNALTYTRVNTPVTPSVLNICRYGGGGYHTSGDYAEIVYYAADIGSGNRAAVRSYLNSKWAIY